MIEVNKVKEIYKGHYQMILDYPTVKFLPQLLVKDMQYVWVVDHIENSEDWKPYNYSLYDKQVDELEMLIEVRDLRMDYIVETSDFLKLVPFINQSITLYQINKKPPRYLDLRRFKGKGKYDLLSKEADYLFEVEIQSATDYAPIVSSSKQFLESLLINYDMENLP